MNTSIQDWESIITIVGGVLSIGGIIWGLVKLLKKRYSPSPATIRVNFFKNNKAWRFRIYNASETDVEAINLKVKFQTDPHVIIRHKEDEIFPSLKRHAHFDIPAYLCCGRPKAFEVSISWNQKGTKRIFQTTEHVSLDT